METGESFKVGNITYKVTDVGLINSSSNMLCDSGYNDGSFTINSTFNTAIIGLSGGVLDLSSQKTSAIVVDNTLSPTTKYADLSLTSANKLSLTAENDTIITEISLGKNTLPIDIAFDKTVYASAINKAFTINSDLYRPASSDLTIQSGEKANESSLMGGKVLLDSVDNVSVKTYGDSVSVASGTVTLEANDTLSAKLYGVNAGDQFTANGIAYSVTKAGLFKKDQIWDSSDYGTIELSTLETDNWADIVTISDGILSLEPENASDKWIILSSDLGTKYATLETLEVGGLSITSVSTAWDAANSISVNNTKVYFPANSFRNKPIKGVASKALFSVTSGEAFSVEDESGGAIIGDATKVSMSSGKIALPKSGQTVLTAGFEEYSVAVASNNAGDGITVILDDSGASLGALSTKNGVDSFIVGRNTYTMLSNGRINRVTDSKYWLSDTIENDGTIAIADLLTSSNWGDFITVSGGILSIDSTTMNNSSASIALVVDKSNNGSIYGKLTKDSDTGYYTLDGTDSNVNAALSGIDVDKSAKSITFIGDYLDKSITADNTVFEVTATSSNTFTVNYTSASLGTDAPGVSLISGSWEMSDTTQTLAADGQTIQIGGTSTTINVSVNGENVTVSGLDAAGEIATVNNNVYSIVSGNGISLNIADDNPIVKGISSGDVFAVGSDEFTKTAKYFTKNNNNNYSLWVSGDVTGGISLSELNEVENNWLAVATVDSDTKEIVIDKNSTTKIFVNSLSNLTSIYGALTVDDAGYNLSNVNGSVTVNSRPGLITVNNVAAGLSSYYAAKTTINAAGASFVANSVTGNTFTVNAEGTNAVLENVSNVSLFSGTLADLTSTTTVRTDSGSIAAQDSSKINVGFDGSTVTISALEDGESFKFKTNRCRHSQG